MHICPHLFFNGQCEAAFRSYEECFGGEVTLMLRDVELPAGPPVLDGGGRIIHATLKLGANTITGADMPTDNIKSHRGLPCR